MKLQNHPAIRSNWASLEWERTNSANIDEPLSLDSRLASVWMPRKNPQHNTLRLMRRGDGAVASLRCESQLLLSNLYQTLCRSIGKSIRQIGNLEVAEDLTVLISPGIALPDPKFDDGARNRVTLKARPSSS